jgi:hypothetical protein
MKSIEQAEELRDNLCSYLEQIKARKYAEGGSATAQFISLNEVSAEMFFGLLCEWIETTKELIVGPKTAADVNETNAARTQTRMKYKFVRIPKEKFVACVPVEEYEAMKELYTARILAATKQEGREWATMQFLNSCAEYPPVVYLDFE